MPIVKARLKRRRQMRHVEGGPSVGETLEEGEARHFGASVSLLLRRPRTRCRRARARQLKLLRGFGGEQDFPSLDRFVSRALAAA